ncbi:hypothetical protein PSQ19_10540 [Devosia algicola]|uniref:Uncharacterized protein n=1 Tax=Devosia algicola TaxID=3026418 RepID=A0ABY7YJL7_9HYPH|nr:hypothetical protein [Devosia algicola]WDR01284.1 hypothetical protein PSQ19_10540 [Devosia algicola]
MPSSSWTDTERSSTDGTYFLAAATMQSWLQFGTVERWWPVNANTSTSSGSNSDSTTGLNLSLGEFGGDYSKSEGSSLDRQIDDYQVTGVSDRGGAKYDWQGCGLAETTAVVDYCLYRSPIDLYDDDTVALKAIKPIATSMTLMQTDTLFKLGPVENLPDKLNLTTYIGANLGAVAIRPKSEEELRRQSMPFGSAEGFKLFYSAEAWERMFESSDTTISRASTEVVESTQTRGFQFVIELDISQLKS